MITREGYYNNINIQYELIWQHIHRETFFLPFDEETRKSTPPIRWLNCSARAFMQKNWDRYHFLKTPMNLYHSLATYKDFPTFSWNWRVKSQQQEIWLQEFKNYITKYDCFIETDSPEIEKSLADAKDIKAFFDKYKVKYYVKFSGSKGFHFLIPDDEFDFLNWHVYNEESETNVKDFGTLLLFAPFGLDGKAGNIVLDKVLLFKMFALRLKTLLSCSTLDTSVQDIKRVCKTAYSWDWKSGLIAYPLDDNMLNSFQKALVTPEKVLSYNNYKRGLLWRNENVLKEERAKLMAQMLSDLGILKIK